MVIYIQDILEPDYNTLCRFLIDLGEEIGTEKTEEGLHNLEITLTKKSKTSIDVDGTGVRFYNYDRLTCKCKVCKLDPEHFSKISIS